MFVVRGEDVSGEKELSFYDVVLFVTSTYDYFFLLLLPRLPSLLVTFVATPQPS